MVAPATTGSVLLPTTLQASLLLLVVLVDLRLLCDNGAMVARATGGIVVFSKLLQAVGAHRAALLPER